MSKTLIFWCTLCAVLVIVVEGVAFSSYYVMRDIYDNGREEVFEKLNPKDLAKFRERRGDPVTGWTIVGPRRKTYRNCLGADYENTADETGARTYDGYERDTVSVVFVGDSYTYGGEVNDEDAYPAVVARNLNLSAANHGVGGFGPVQSFLNLKRIIGFYPNTKVVVLGIMYENVYRMLNSYRPVLYDGSARYGLKPYISEGRIEPHPGEIVLKDLSAFTNRARAAFEHDFWARPRHRFPYSVALARGLSSNYFYFRILQKKFRKLGVPEYFLTYRSETVSSDLLSLLDRFTAFARERNLKPVAMFIPRNKNDTQSPTKFLKVNLRRLDPELLVVDVGQASIEWERFNMIDDGDPCHPSAYGYEKIAEHLVAAFQQEGLLPESSE